MAALQRRERTVGSRRRCSVDALVTCRRPGLYTSLVHSCTVAHVLVALGCAAAVPCRTDFECSFNGECTAGSCVCAPAWTGAYCHELNLLPANNNTGLNQLHDEPPISHWGAAVLLGDDQLYHMHLLQPMCTASLALSLSMSLCVSLRLSLSLFVISILSGAGTPARSSTLAASTPGVPTRR